MLIRLLAIGTKMPVWINMGFQEYVKRFPPGWQLTLHEIPAEKRSKNSDIPRIIQLESEKLLAATKNTNRIIVLDVKGQSWSTEQLAKNLETWSLDNRHLDLLIGGPDGLSEAILKKADCCWSLSPLTLPHPLVRVILAEQLYRAQSLLHNHPYHR